MTARRAGVVTDDSEWLVKGSGRYRPERKAHRLRAHGMTICGTLDPSAVGTLIPAPAGTPRCVDCTKGYRDVAEALSNHTVSENGCWIWGGYMDDNGYGRVYAPDFRPGICWVHRTSYEFHNGPIAKRHEVDHICQTTACMNPAHLEQVTKAEHAARTFRRLGFDDKHAFAAQLRVMRLTYDEIAEALGMVSKTGAAQAVKAAIRKGLVDPADVPPVVRTTDADHTDMRAMYEFGIPQLVIARFYDIDGSQVSRIVNGRTSRSKKVPEPVQLHAVRGVA